MRFLKDYEINPYEHSIVRQEAENIDYQVSENRKGLYGGVIHLPEKDVYLDAFAFSNAISLSGNQSSLRFYEEPPLFISFRLINF